MCLGGQLSIFRDNIFMSSLFVSCQQSKIETFRSFYGAFQIGFFEPGQGLTVANALRRTLLSEMKGLSITQVEIQGATHEYSALPGVRESVLDIVLNFKEVVFKSTEIQSKPFHGYVLVRGPGVIRAGDILLPKGIECVDPNQYIATLSDDGILNAKLHIQNGKFVNLKSSKEESNLNKKVFSNIFALNALKPSDLTSLPIFIEPSFLSINKVNYIIEPDSFNGQPKERIVLEIWTNGSVHPRQALSEAFQSLFQIFSNLEKVLMVNSLFLKSFVSKDDRYQKLLNKLKSFDFVDTTFFPSQTNETIKPLFITTEEVRKSNSNKFDFYKNILFLGQTSRNYWTVKKLKSIDVGTLNISLRPYTCLKRANIHTLFDLVQYSQKELLELKSFGKKSFEEIQRSLQELGLELK